MTAAGHPAPAATRFARFEGASLVGLRGKDALSFLQTKLTQDVRTWRQTGGGAAGAVDIQGRLLFEAECWLAGPNEALLLVFGVEAEAVIAHLDRYVISEDVTFEDLSTTHAVVLLLGGATDPVRTFERHDDGRIEVSGDLGAGASGFIAVPRGAIDAIRGRLVTGGAVELPLQAWLDARVAGGLPTLGREYGAAEIIPLEAGRWSTVSFRKGCYLGQEVIERLYSRGSPARRLLHLEGLRSATAVGNVIRSAGDDAGVVRSVATVDGVHHALGFVKRAFLRPDATFELDGEPVPSWSYVGGERPEQV
jgi:folate-binding protein YgfZ